MMFVYGLSTMLQRLTAAGGKKPNPKLVKKLIHARILGYILLYIPSDSPKANLARQIHSCSTRDNQPAKLDELGELFETKFILPFLKHKGKTLATSDHSSRRSLDKKKKEITDDIEEAPTGHAKAKEDALIRDRYRCQITGKYDKSAIKHNIDTPREIIKTGAIYTQCAHIIPESTYFNVRGSDTEVKRAYTASVLAILDCFGCNHEKLNGKNAHNLYNVATMEANVHDLFDRLELWFESTGTANQYRPDTSSEVSRSLFKEVVTFTSPNLELFPLPSPELLALHATCAKVAHLSGAAEFIGKYDRDLDDLDVLASDGSSSIALDYLILARLGTAVEVDAGA